MVKKKKKMVGKRKPRKVSVADRFLLIEKALRKQTKADIVELFLLLAKKHASLARDLENRLAIEKPVEVLSADVSSAIDRATDFGDHMMNHNFDFATQLSLFRRCRSALLKKMKKISHSFSASKKEYNSQWENTVTKSKARKRECLH